MMQMIKQFKILLLLLPAIFLEGCTKDILSGQPEWLGNSIYERLSEGITVNVDGVEKHETFETTLKLINSLEQTDVLAQTGSKTLFVASDDAFEEWFRTNSWGVRKYEDLSLAQKKLLLFNSMINNAYLLNLMSNVSGNPPQEGMCMRRPTAASIQDSVGIIKAEDMPIPNFGKESLDAWKPYRDAGKSLKLFRDNTAAPMIHFLPAFMMKDSITNTDLEILTNGVSKSIEDSWINGKKVISSEQTCKNGYIYVVDGVVEKNRNLAEIINEEPEMQQWAKLMNRFSAPFYEKASSDEYNRINGTNDSVFILRYYADEFKGKTRSAEKFNSTPSGSKVPATLSFDPGWNQYIYLNSMGYDMHYDAGVMIVPTNEALNEWWNNAGLGLQQEYGSWDNVPAITLSKLLRVNMLSSFKDAVPSKFSHIVDDSKVPLGITPNNIVKSFVGCNGIIYLVNTVFAPSEYRSVVYPALSHQSLMSVIYYAIDQYDFGPYLNSMDSYFSMILPTNKAMLTYLDPCYYGLPQEMLWSFYYDEEEQKVLAKRYYVTVENGEVRDTIQAITSAPSDAMIKNRLSDIVDNLIVVGNIENNDYQYFKTKAGSVIKVEKNGSPVSSKSKVSAFVSGMNEETGKKTEVTHYYDMTQPDASGENKGNGMSYGVDKIPMTSAKSVYEILSAETKDTLFFKLMNGDETANAFLTATLKIGSTSYYCANDEVNKNVRLFDKYNYTIYVPTDAAIQKLIDSGYLPTWDDYNKCNDEALRDTIAARIQDFIRYHIQDNSVYVGAEPINNTKYETAKLNTSNNRFYSLEVNSTESGLTVRDQLGNERKVVTSDKLVNKTAREYWISGARSSMSRSLYSSSDAVIHKIDDVLLFSKSQLTHWQK